MITDAKSACYGEIAQAIGSYGPRCRRRTPVAFLNCANGTLLPLTVLEPSATMLLRIKGKNFSHAVGGWVFDGWKHSRISESGFSQGWSLLARCLASSFGCARGT